MQNENHLYANYLYGQFHDAAKARGDFDALISPPAHKLSIKIMLYILQFSKKFTMSAATDKKSIITSDNKEVIAMHTSSPSANSTQSSSSTPSENNASESLRKAIKALDAEHTKLGKKHYREHQAR